MPFYGGHEPSWDALDPTDIDWDLMKDIYEEDLDARADEAYDAMIDDHLADLHPTKWTQCPLCSRSM